MIGSYGIFVISPFLTFSGSRNPFLDVSRSYHVRVTPKICQLPVSEVFKGTDDWVLRIFVISPFTTFSKSISGFLEATMSK